MVCTFVLTAIFPFVKNMFVLFADEFSVLKIEFHLSRHTGYFLIQIYLPCILLVVLSWVSFWLNREATADRVGLGMCCPLYTLYTRERYRATILFGDKNV